MILVIAGIVLLLAAMDMSGADDWAAIASLLLAVGCFLVAASDRNKPDS